LPRTRKRALTRAANFLFLIALPAWAQSPLVTGPSITGQGGLISMPDARFAPEGTWRVGVSQLKPYSAFWSSISMFPWLEGSFRYTRIANAPPGFSTAENQSIGVGYGSFKDKAFDAKALLLPERSWLPAIAFGVQDVGGGTGIWRAPYGVMSKQLGPLDLTLGYGGQRIDGVFGGARWTPAAAPRWSVVAEYDAYNYKRDPFAELSGAAKYGSAPAAGLEYRGDMWGAKLFSGHGVTGFNTYLSVPLDTPGGFLPKVKEPEPYTKINPRPTEEQWASDARHRGRLARALVAQDFRDVALGYENGRLSATLTNTRISSMPRAVGRAARTLLSFAPLEVREIRVTYEQGTLPVATYTFIDARLLSRYFNGMASREMLAPTVAIEYAKPGAAREEQDRAETLAAFEEPLPEALVLASGELDVGALGREVAGGRVRVAPALATYFNDPSGAVKFEAAALGTYDRPLARQTFLQAATKLRVWENVSDVTQPSNSTLPHVRTDIAEYFRGDRFKLTRLLVNQFYQPAERVYARASAGIYEEMFGGAGGQVLYLPRDGSWGADLAVDALKQRDFTGWFGFQDYSTVTAIGSLHYKMAQDVTATARAGRFLAGDRGVRGEIKRRFRSGWEVGAWYTVTNGHDITAPGTPESPYHDKGVFMLIPLDTLLTYDTQAAGGISLAPWTRDVGQMVISPGDLYAILERPVYQLHTRDGLSGLGDRNDDYDLPQLGADRRWPEFAAQDFFSTARVAGEVDWPRSVVVGGAAILGAAALDQSAARFAQKHEASRWLTRTVTVGNALPVVALGASAVFAFDTSRPQLSDAGVAALEGAGLALLASTGLKYAVGRERPSAGEGRSDFDPGSRDDRFHSFPSRHTALMFAAVTPYAREYDMPWLYGVAALTNVARTWSREHWFSDTVAGSLIGVAAGTLAWEARRESRRKNAPRVTLTPGGVGVAWALD
jgi:membrane-associated phospholipid phosphatase